MLPSLSKAIKTAEKADIERKNSKFDSPSETSTNWKKKPWFNSRSSFDSLSLIYLNCACELSSPSFIIIIIIIIVSPSLSIFLHHVVVLSIIPVKT